MSQVSKFKFKFKFIKNALEFNIYENYIKLGFKTVFQTLVRNLFGKFCSGFNLFFHLLPRNNSLSNATF